MDIDRIAKAKEILANIRYVTISSVSKDGEPWGTPVLAVFDEQYNCYWTSLNSTQHSKNIQENPSVYLTCFDSTVEPGEGGGVYIRAHAEEMATLPRLRGRRSFSIPAKINHLARSKIFSVTPQKECIRQLPKNFR